MVAQIGDRYRRHLPQEDCVIANSVFVLVSAQRDTLLPVAAERIRTLTRLAAISRVVFGIVFALIALVFLLGTIQVLIAASYLGPLLGALAFGVAAVFLLAPAVRRMLPNERQLELGKVGSTILRLARRGHRTALEQYLVDVLPPWSIGDLIRRTALELLEIRVNAKIAREVGVPDGITNELATEAQHALEALAPIADRVVAVAAQHVPHGPIEKRLQEETNALQQLLDSAKSSRASLAALTLSAGSDADLQEARVRLNAMGKVARELITLNEESPLDMSSRNSS